MYQQPKCPYSYFSRWSSVLGCFFPVSIFNYDDKWKQLRQNDLSKQLAVFSNDIRKWLRKEIALQEENWGSGNSAPGDSSNMDDTIITIDQFCFLKKISLKYVIEISLKISLNQVYNFSPNKYPRNKILSRTVFTLNRINFRVEHFACKCGTNFHAFWTFLLENWYARIILPLSISNMQNSVVMFTFSALDQKKHFWANLSQKVIVLCLKWNLVTKLFRQCGIRWLCSFFCFCFGPEIAFLLKLVLMITFIRSFCLSCLIWLCLVFVLVNCSQFLKMFQLFRPSC